MKENKDNKEYNIPTIVSLKEIQDAIPDINEEKALEIVSFLNTSNLGTMKHHEIAEALGITKQRVQQIETKAMKKIKVILLNYPELRKNLKQYTHQDLDGYLSVI